MNILLTSAGRRTYMVKYFKEAIKPYGGKVFAINSSLEVPSIWLADHYAQAPLIHSENYADFLEGYCLKNQIKLIISLFDIELPALSKLKNQFLEKGITIIVADSWVTEMANDKWATNEFLKKHHFNTVPTFKNIATFKEAINNNETAFPVFIKPRWGMGSIGLYKADNWNEFEFYYQLVKKEIQQSYLQYESKTAPEESVLIQALLSGKEHGLDIINNLKGEHQTTIVKQKLAMRSGETDAAIVLDEPVLSQLGKKLAELTKHPANMDVDVFFDGSTPYILEINPRFGGGYPFSHIAGVNLPKAILQWYHQETVQPETLHAKIGCKSYKGIELIKEFRSS
jgi:carbamoyl-phosphate synthase large subunit